MKITLGERKSRNRSQTPLTARARPRFLAGAMTTGRAIRSVGMQWALAAVVIAGWMQGCVVVPVHFLDADQLREKVESTVRLGQTTMEEAEKAFGKPSARWNVGRLWFYALGDTVAGVGVGGMLPVPHPIWDTHIHARLWLSFDDGGLVKSVALERSGRLLPFPSRDDTWDILSDPTPDILDVLSALVETHGYRVEKSDRESSSVVFARDKGSLILKVTGRILFIQAVSQDGPSSLGVRKIRAALRQSGLVD